MSMIRPSLVVRAFEPRQIDSFVEQRCRGGGTLLC
jgi:hypothetical protein